jgi:hypothetical protein
MSIENKIFMTSLLFCILLIGFIRCNKQEDVPDLIKVIVIVLFAVSILGIIVPLLMMIWN